ncbi:MAG: GrpB family protein [Oscillospiraceae bacterium]|nr:GrpB family protein [Oscillospiraceae bacterium]
MLKSEWNRTDEQDLILREYNPEYPTWFSEEKVNLTGLIGAENIVRIRHIGSTTVPGLLAKPTIDILLEIADNTDIDKLIAALPKPEYICLNPPDMPTPPPHLMFLKGYTATGFAERVFHIHVRYNGDWEEPLFRDYLIAHPDTAAEYANLKRGLFGAFEHDRDGYTSAKTAFIRNVMKKARESHDNA